MSDVKGSSSEVTESLESVHSKDLFKRFVQCLARGPDCLCAPVPLTGLQHRQPRPNLAAVPLLELGKERISWGSDPVQSDR